MCRNRERGGVVAGVLMTVGLLFLAAIAVTVGTAWYLAHNIRVRDSGRGATRIETPFGSLRVSERARLDPGSLGIPGYPGAVRVDDDRKVASFELDLGDLHKDFIAAGVEFETADPLERVEQFYREQLSGASIKHSRPRHVVFTVSEGDAHKVVALRESGSGTRIALASVGPPAAN